MSRFWTRCKTAFVLVAACATLGGCYEGFKDRGPGDKGAGADGGGGKANTADKIYGLTLLDVIRPAAAALTDPSCGNVASSLADIRTNEMNARVNSLTALLDAQSVSLRMITTEIPPDDCANFLALESRSRTALPDPQLLDDSVKPKPALHVRLVLWFGDRSPKAPAPSVLAREWADMARLQDLGFTRRLSVNHFAFIGANAGYVWNWWQAADQALNFIAKVVPDPGLTDSGLAEIGAAVNASTAMFADWLHQKVTGI